jgi:hypothetical protein
MQKLTISKWSEFCLLFSAVTLIMFLSGCGGKSQTEPAWNIAGSWYTYYVTTGTPGEQGPNVFTFTTNENTLSGTTYLNQWITGTVSGSNVNFSWTESDGATNTSTGTIGANGTTMSGTWTDTNNQSGIWSAIIDTSPEVNIAGNWNIYQATAGAAGEQGPDLFTFSQSGNGISGTTAQGEQITGTIGGLSITFFWVGNDGTTNTLTGTVNADGTALSGTWASTNGQSGTWHATKSG